MILQITKCTIAFTAKERKRSDKEEADSPLAPKTPRKRQAVSILASISSTGLTVGENQRLALFCGISTNPGTNPGSSQCPEWSKNHGGGRATSSRAQLHTRRNRISRAIDPQERRPVPSPMCTSKSVSKCSCAAMLIRQSSVSRYSPPHESLYPATANIVRRSPKRNHAQMG